MKVSHGYLIFCSALLFSCSQSTDSGDAVAIWSLSDLKDKAGKNSELSASGNIQFVDKAGDEKIDTKGSLSDGKAIYLDGSSWLNAGQGVDGELKVNGKGLTMYAKFKLDTINEFNPVLNKAGNDQSVAYRIDVRKKGEDVYVEAMMGSDDIGGAHLLKYKLPKEEWHNWQAILFRFNGKISELYVNGLLRDNEITEGDTRDWNSHPVLIGADYKYPYINGDSAANTLHATFKGWVDGVAIWNKYLEDKSAADVFGVASLNNDGLPEYYTEKYRPQFHFTSKKNWINDPNGLVYYDGTYHLFFQYMPTNRHGAYKDWGHAISKDLVNWEQVPEHITPHKVWSGCWSGSAVVDHKNVSGFQKGKEKPIIAFITNGGNPDGGYGAKCTQCIAYSVDGGKTFTYYDQNPVIRNINGANRDPKVVWDEDSKQWIMSLYMDKGFEFGLFGSTNLREWKQLSTLSADRIAECPGFEPFIVDGDVNKKKWIFSGANGNYQIGTFNGKEFKPESGILVGDYGNNFYAPQTWSDVPNDRKVQIAWMPTNRYPDMPFEQQMNFPTQLDLKTTPEGLRLHRMPVEEIKNLYDKESKWQKVVGRQAENPLADLKGDLYDFEFEIDVNNSSAIEIGARGATIQYDAKTKTLRCGAKSNIVKSGFPPDHWRAFDRKDINDFNNMGEAKLSSVNGKIKLRILIDRTTVEIFGNDGLVVITSSFMPDESKHYSLSSDNDINVNASIHSLNSAWAKQKK
jgi:sucrose-6-phosphate hydrolase SacC (GH32 family)